MAINYKNHGGMMWLAWGLFSLVQAGVNRYCKSNLHRIYMWVHRVIGTSMLLITLIYGGWAFTRDEVESDSRIGVHAVLVQPVLFLTFFLAVGGVFTRSMMRRLKRKTRLIIKIKRAHKGFAYTLIALGCLSIIFGMLEYHALFVDDGNGVGLVLLHLAYFLVVTLFVEFSHRSSLVQELAYELEREKSGEERVIHLEEFKRRINLGDKLVILDDLVLNVGDFMDDHPGGRYSIEANVGKEVSKYFYGGYRYENIDQPMIFNTHSSVAKGVVSQLAIGRLDEPARYRVMKIQDVQENSNANLRGSVKTIRFVSAHPNTEEGKKQANPLSDIRNIGKYYLLKCTSHKSSPGTPSKPGWFEGSKVGIKRHYTECFSIRYEFRNMLNQVIENPDDKALIKKFKDLIGFFTDKNLCLTIKDYKSHPKGLSHYIHADIISGTNQYEVKGLMGRGIDVRTSGDHTAFVAGTGVLPFLDLVGHLILRILSEKSGENVADFFESNKIDLNNFRFNLHTAYSDEDEAIGLDLIKILQDLCFKNQYPSLFKHYSQSRATSTKRWDEQFFKDQIEIGLREGAKKIWVCGPPVMQEECERALENYNIAKSQLVQIM